MEEKSLTKIEQLKETNFKQVLAAVVSIYEQLNNTKTVKGSNHF